MKLVFQLVALSFILVCCAEQSSKREKTPSTNIGIKNPTSADSISEKLKEIEVLIEANEKAIEKLNE